MEISQDMARNALGCLDLRRDIARGQELYVICDGLTDFKPALAQAISQEACSMGASVAVLNMDDFLNAHEDDDEAIAAMKSNLKYVTANPLRRNAVNMVAPVGRHDNVRRRVTRGLLEDKVYVLQFPFVHQQTAEAILSTDPVEAEEVALRMKADLDKATHYRLETGKGHVMEWPVNPKLVWVPSVGMIKKYSPLGKNGEPIGGWGNPGCETFTSFAATTDDYKKINGSFYVDAFASARVLRDNEAFAVEGVNGAVDVERFKRENRHIGGKLMDSLVKSFTTDQYAGHFGELGIGLMPSINLRDTRETLPLEKIGGTLHIAPGYDESDRGTGGGFLMSKAHNDLGMKTPHFEAKINGKWKTVLSGGKCNYFAA